MIERFRLANFKGHVDTSLELGRLTVLVGDNGSGKTSVLEALQVLSCMPPGSTPASIPATFIRTGTPAFTIEKDAKWTFSDDGTGRWLVNASWAIEKRGDRVDGPISLYQLNSHAIAQPTYSDDVAARVGYDGQDTAVALGRLKLERLPDFLSVQEALVRLVPTLESVNVLRAPVRRLSPSSPGMIESVVGNRLGFDFRGAHDLVATQASQGTLILTALLTILYERRSNLILLDDLDQALHPRAQMELMKYLLELLALPEFSELQIVATAHSPYILDALSPKDIYVFATDDHGVSHAKRLSEHPDADSAKIGTGHLWTLDPEQYWVLKAS